MQTEGITERQGKEREGERKGGREGERWGDRHCGPKLNAAFMSNS